MRKHVRMLLLFSNSHIITVLLGIMPKVPVKNVKYIKIELYWEDEHSKGSNYFDNVQKFAEFL